jgi:hypothetical protein
MSQLTDKEVDLVLEKLFETGGWRWWGTKDGGRSYIRAIDDILTAIKDGGAGR